MFETIKKVCLLIALDNGGINRNRSVEQQDAEVTKWLKDQADKRDLQTFEEYLKLRTDEELDLIATGGDDDEDREKRLMMFPKGMDDFFNDYFDEVC